MPERDGNGHFIKKTKKEIDLAAKDRTPFLDEFRSNVIPYLKTWEEITSPANPLRVLAIDPGKVNIALAFIDLEHDSYLTSKIQPPELKTAGGLILYQERIIEYWVKMFKPDVIFKEGVAHGSEFGVAEAGKLQYIVDRVAIEWGVPVITIANTTMRKFIGASGGDNTKADVKLRVFQRYGKEFSSEDECDAYAIAQTGIAFVGGLIDIKGKKYPAKVSE